MAMIQIDTLAFEQSLQDHLDEKCKEIADQIRKDAKANLGSPNPFKDITGRLRRSIKTRKSKFMDGGYMVRAGGKGAMQAWLVEHGHGGPAPAPPHPYLRPALDRNIAFARMKLREKMRAGIMKRTSAPVSAGEE